MRDSIVISNQSRFWIPYRNLDFLKTTQPFIAEVARRVSASGDIEESVLRAAEAHPNAVPYFVIDPGKILDTFTLREEYMFADAQPRSLVVERPGDRREVVFSGEAEELRDLNTLLSLSASGLYDAESIRARLNEGGRVLFDSFLNRGVLAAEPRRVSGFAPEGHAGVYRLQHASLLYRTATTGVLADPHLHSTYGSIVDDIHKDHLNSKVDAVLVSHFHEDHWFLATLLMFDRDTPIVVPKVPRSTIICGNMEAMLRSYGFRRVIAVDWYSAPLRFGDIEVHVLPFYGEQPLRYQDSKDKSIRNWGNTYLIRTEQYTSWFLIDSGADARGSMSEVAHHVRERMGKVDMVLSNLRRFAPYTPFYINNGSNWLTLSPQQIREFAAMRRHCITLGPPGVAEVCRTVEAPYFLPYAHWWGEIGEVGDSGYDQPGQGEEGLTKELAGCLREINAPTRVVPWRIGDGFLARAEGGFHHAPIGR